MYKAFVSKRLVNGKVEEADYVQLTMLELNACMSDYDTVLGFDGMQWVPYRLWLGPEGVCLSPDAKYYWREVSTFTTSTLAAKQFGDIVIQKLIDEGYLEVIQDITEEEYEVQLALGTIIEGPRKICTKPNSRMKKKLATISGMNNL